MTQYYLEDELLNNDLILSLVKDDTFAQNLYAAMCNMKWVKNGDEWTCSWRYAGELVSDLRGVGEDYLDFYCSGIGVDYRSGYMPEGHVAPQVMKALTDMGWSPRQWEEEKDVI